VCCPAEPIARQGRGGPKRTGYVVASASLPDRSPQIRSRRHSLVGKRSELGEAARCIFVGIVERRAGHFVVDDAVVGIVGASAGGKNWSRTYHPSSKVTATSPAPDLASLVVGRKLSIALATVRVFSARLRPWCPLGGRHFCPAALRKKMAVPIFRQPAFQPELRTDTRNANVTVPSPRHGQLQKHRHRHPTRPRQQGTVTAKDDLGR
jgi:hypothetical protein